MNFNGINLLNMWMGLPPRGFFDSSGSSDDDLFDSDSDDGLFSSDDDFFGFDDEEEDEEEEEEDEDDEEEDEKTGERHRVLVRKDPQIERRQLSTQPFPPHMACILLLLDGSWLTVDGYRNYIIKRWIRRINPKGDVTMMCHNTWPLHHLPGFNTTVVLKELRGLDCFLCFFNWDLVRWNYKTGEKVVTYDMKSDIITPHLRSRSVAVLRDNMFASSCGSSKVVTLWNVDNEKPTGQLEMKQIVSCICSIHNGEHLAVKFLSDTIEIWDPVTSSHIKTISCRLGDETDSSNFELSEWGPDHLVCQRLFTEKLEVFEIESGKIVLHCNRRGLVLNKDILMVRKLKHGSQFFRPPSSLDFINHKGEVLFHFYECHQSPEIISLSPGIFAVLYWWDTFSLGPKDIPHQRLDVWQYGSERFDDRRFHACNTQS